MRDENCCTVVRCKREALDLLSLYYHVSICQNKNSTLHRTSGHGMLCCCGCGGRCVEDV